MLDNRLKHFECLGSEDIIIRPRDSIFSFRDTLERIDKHELPLRPRQRRDLRHQLHARFDKAERIIRRD